MEEGDRPGTLVSELLRQNYAFVASFSVIIWDCLITFRQEVKYVWHSPSTATKCLFLFFRYGTVGYFMACSIFGTQWVLIIPATSDHCRAWFLTHVAWLSLVYLGSQAILVRKIFNLYARSTLLATGLLALHCIQVAGSYVVALHATHALYFNPICNGHDMPRIVLSISTSVILTQGLTWALILRKIWNVRSFFASNWRNYLRTSEAHMKMSWGVCLLAIILNSSHSFANRRVAPVYIFTFPMVVVSIGTCRYILRLEKDEATRSKLPKAVDANEAMILQTVLEQQSPSTELGKTKQNQLRFPDPPHPPAEIPRPLLRPEGRSIQTPDSHTGEHTLDMVISNFPYLHGARSYYRLHQNRISTPNTSIISANQSLQSSSEWANRRTATVRMSRSRDSEVEADLISVLQAAGVTELAEGNKLTSELEETQSVSSIEIGSLQSSSSVNSEELRRFYNYKIKVSDPLMVGSP